VSYVLVEVTVDTMEPVNEDDEEMMRAVAREIQLVLDLQADTLAAHGVTVSAVEATVVV
jgi:hypothetical protein